VEVQTLEACLRLQGQLDPIVYRTYREDGALVVLFSIPGLERNVRVARTAYLIGGRVVSVIDGFEA